MTKGAQPDNRRGHDGPKLRTDPRYETLAPPMPEQDYAALKESIRSKGQDEVIITNPDLVVLDGHNRLKICLELGIEPRYETRRFGSQVEEFEFAIRANLNRRQLNTFQKIELAFKLEQPEAEKARERQIRAPHRRYGAPALGRIQPNEGEGGRVIDKCAATAGVAPDTYRKARWIILSGQKTLIEKLRKGEISIDAAYLRITMKGTGKRRVAGPRNLPTRNFERLFARSLSDKERGPEANRQKT